MFFVWKWCQNWVPIWLYFWNRVENLIASTNLDFCIYNHTMAPKMEPIRFPFWAPIWFYFWNLFCVRIFAIRCPSATFCRNDSWELGVSISICRPPISALYFAKRHIFGYILSRFPENLYFRVRSHRLYQMNDWGSSVCFWFLVCKSCNFENLVVSDGGGPNVWSLNLNQIGSKKMSSKFCILQPYWRPHYHFF